MGDHSDHGPAAVPGEPGQLAALQHDFTDWSVHAFWHQGAEAWTAVRRDAGEHDDFLDEPTAAALRAKLETSRAADITLPQQRLP